MFRARVICLFLLLAVAAAGAWAQGVSTGTLRGVLTDESGAVVPAATVTLTGKGGQKSAQTQADGTYVFSGLTPGEYSVSVQFPGFAPFTKPVTIASGGAVRLDIPMSLAEQKQEVTVAADGAGQVSVDQDNNASKLVLKGEDLQSLPDDPDDLADALQALAGPGAGPNGGQIYIDGFSGGQLPPKESIREIRINQNPFSAEYDRLGYGRIEILTRPGSDRYRGTIAINDSNSIFNSRNPIVPNKPDYSNRMIMANVGGPLGKRASFFLDFNRRDITDNAIVTADFLDPQTFGITNFSQAIVTPNMRTTIAPRFDYQLSTNHTLTLRFEEGWNSRENAGIGNFTLPPPLSQAAYNSTGNNQNFMATETAIIHSRIVNETRFQFARSYTAALGNEIPTINVANSFVTGGNQVGDQFDTRRHFEFQNNTSVTQGRHVIRFGIRTRRMSEQDNAPSGYGGTFLFLGGIAPVLDANNQPVVGDNGQAATAQITSLEQYRRTLLGLPGGGPSQFTINAGNPYASIVQWDFAPFVQDDWKFRPNLTISAGLRFEAQTNIAAGHDFAPRIGVAWAPGSARNGAQKTVIRGGFGIFYDRVGENLFMQAYRLNGFNQLSYVVQNPTFYPNIPDVSTLTPSQNTTFRIDPNLRSEYMLQTAIGVERQLPRNSTMAVTYTYTRGLHLEQTVPINTALPGTYSVPGTGVFPYGATAGNIFAYESGGLLKQNMLMVNFNTRVSRNVSLSGNYSLNYASDLPGTPTNPYDFAQDWGRSTLDRRHRLLIFGTVSAPLGLRLNPFVTLQSGSPYDLSLGRDIYGNTERNARPALYTGQLLPGETLVPTPFGEFVSYLPGQGVQLVPRNYLSGAGLVSVNMRISRTFGFGAPRGGHNAAPSGGFGGPGGGFGGGRGGFGGGGPRGGGMRMGGGPRGGGGFFGGDTTTEHRYNLTLSLMVNNVLNHYNPANYVGVITSPFLGQPLGINTGFGGGPGAGGFGGVAAANNRRVELQMRFTF